MTDTIILQQLQLHFGDDFHRTYQNTKSYIKGLIGRPWWVDKRTLINNEGPLPRMVEDCLAHVVDKGDMQAGWTAYTKYLTSLYGTSYVPSSWRSLDGLDGDHFVWTTLGGHSVGSSSSGEPTVVEVDVSDEEYQWFDEDQADFLAMYTTMGAAAAAKAFGISQEQARTRRNTIKKTVRRRVNSA